MNLEIELRYTWFVKNMCDLTPQDATDYIDQYHKVLDRDLWFTLFQDCKYVNGNVWKDMFLSLYSYYPTEACHYLKYFSWFDYIVLLSYMDMEKYPTLAKKIIKIITEQMYSERNGLQPISPLADALPRERKNLDRRTGIVRLLAKNYYFLCKEKNRESEWEDIMFDQPYKKSDALKLYRKDCSYLREKLIEKKQV